MHLIPQRAASELTLTGACCIFGMNQQFWSPARIISRGIKASLSLLNTAFLERLLCLCCGPNIYSPDWEELRLLSLTLIKVWYVFFFFFLRQKGWLNLLWRSQTQAHSRTVYTATQTRCTWSRLHTANAHMWPCTAGIHTCSVHMLVKEKKNKTE